MCFDCDNGLEIFTKDDLAYIKPCYKAKPHFELFYDPAKDTIRMTIFYGPDKFETTATRYLLYDLTETGQLQDFMQNTFRPLTDKFPGAIVAVKEIFYLLYKQFKPGSYYDDFNNGQKYHPGGYVPAYSIAPDYPFMDGGRRPEVSKLPGLNEMVKHPETGYPSRLEDVIINLNDSHGWTRERIADWLETLDVDLRFGVEPKPTQRKLFL